MSISFLSSPVYDLTDYIKGSTKYNAITLTRLYKGKQAPTECIHNDEKIIQGRNNEAALRGEKQKSEGEG